MVTFAELLFMAFVHDLFLLTADVFSLAVAAVSLAAAAFSLAFCSVWRDVVFRLRIVVLSIFSPPFSTCRDSSLFFFGRFFFLFGKKMGERWKRFMLSHL